MARFYYDLHLHSCLSPCGDNDMTPANIAAMAALKELDIIALTDHNSCRNCPALLEHAAAGGLLALPGMEINTIEEIHAICLFPTLEDALAFDQYVYERLPVFPNDPLIYGQQQVINAADQPTEEIPKLLISGCAVSIMELTALVASYRGVCFPAHIDKPSYSILSVLGTVPPECGFPTVEINQAQLIDQVLERHEDLGGLGVLTNSDAHYLWDISERYHYIDLEEKSIDCLFEAIGQA